MRVSGHVLISAVEYCKNANTILQAHIYIFPSPFSSKRNRTINRKFTFNGVIVVAHAFKLVATTRFVVCTHVTFSFRVRWV